MQKNKNKNKGGWIFSVTNLRCGWILINNTVLTLYNTQVICYFHFDSIICALHEAKTGMSIF